MILNQKKMKIRGLACEIMDNNRLKAVDTELLAALEKAYSSDPENMTKINDTLMKFDCDNLKERLHATWGEKLFLGAKVSIIVIIVVRFLLLATNTREGPHSSGKHKKTEVHDDGHDHEEEMAPPNEGPAEAKPTDPHGELRKRLSSLLFGIESATIISISFYLLYRFDMTDIWFPKWFPGHGRARSAAFLTIVQRFFVSLLAMLVLMQQVQEVGSHVGMKVWWIDVIKFLIYSSIVASEIKTSSP